MKIWVLLIISKGPKVWASAVPMEQGEDCGFLVKGITPQGPGSGILLPGRCPGHTSSSDETRAAPPCPQLSQRLQGPGLLPLQPPSPRFRCHTPGPLARLLVPRLPPHPSSLWGPPGDCDFLCWKGLDALERREDAEAVGPPPGPQQALSHYQQAPTGQATLD